MGLPGATNLDLSDREFMLIVNDLSHGKSRRWIPIDRLADHINLSVRYPRRNLSSRLAYMCRNRWVERHPKEASYRLTRMGRVLVSSRPSKQLETALRKMTHSQRIEAEKILSQAAFRSGASARTMFRRQFKHSMKIR